MENKETGYAPIHLLKFSHDFNKLAVARGSSLQIWDTKERKQFESEDLKIKITLVL